MQLFYGSWQQRLTVVSLVLLACLYAVDFLKAPSLPNFQQWAQEQSQSALSSRQRPTSSHQETNIAIFSAHVSNSTSAEEAVVGSVPATFKAKDKLQTGIVSSRQKGDGKQEGKKKKMKKNSSGGAKINAAGSGVEATATGGSSSPPSPPTRGGRRTSRNRSFKFRNASWLPDVGAWLSKCAAAPPIRITEVSSDQRAHCETSSSRDRYRIRTHYCEFLDHTYAT